MSESEAMSRAVNIFHDALGARDDAEARLNQAKAHVRDAASRLLVIAEHEDRRRRLPRDR